MTTTAGSASLSSCHSSRHAAGEPPPPPPPPLPLAPADARLPARMRAEAEWDGPSARPLGPPPPPPAPPDAAAAATMAAAATCSAADTLAKQSALSRDERPVESRTVLPQLPPQRSMPAPHLPSRPSQGPKINATSPQAPHLPSRAPRPLHQRLPAPHLSPRAPEPQTPPLQRLTCPPVPPGPLVSEASAACACRNAAYWCCPSWLAANAEKAVGSGAPPAQHAAAHTRLPQTLRKHLIRPATELCHHRGVQTDTNPSAHTWPPKHALTSSAPDTKAHPKAAT